MWFWIELNFVQQWNVIAGLLAARSSSSAIRTDYAEPTIAARGWSRSGGLGWSERSRLGIVTVGLAAELVDHLDQPDKLKPRNVAAIARGRVLSIPVAGDLHRVDA